MNDALQSACVLVYIPFLKKALYNSQDKPKNGNKIAKSQSVC